MFENDNFAQFEPTSENSPPGRPFALKSHGQHHASKRGPASRTSRARWNVVGARRRQRRSPQEAAFTQARLIAAQVPMPFECALVSLDDGRRLRAAENHRRLSHSSKRPIVSSPAWAQIHTCRPAPRNSPP